MAEGRMQSLEPLVGKTVAAVTGGDGDYTGDEFVVLHFTDGSLLLVTADRNNVASARLGFRLAHGHHREPPPKEGAP